MAIEFLHEEWINLVDLSTSILPDNLSMELSFDSCSIDEDYYPELRDPSHTAIFLTYKNGDGIIASRTVQNEKWKRDRCIYLIGLLKEMIEEYVILRNEVK